MLYSIHLFLLLLLLLVPTASPLKVVIDSKNDATFRVIHDARTLFYSGDLAVFVGNQWCVPNANSTAAYSLERVGDWKETRGYDETLGAFTSLTQQWKCHTTASQSIRVITTVQNFDSKANVVFQVSYPDGAYGILTGSWTGSMAHWPSLLNSTTTLGAFLSWQGTFMNPIASPSQGSNGGPIVFYNDTDTSLSTVIVASVWNGNWKAFSSGNGMDWKGQDVLWAPGTSARIKRLPKGYQQSVILHASTGITNAMSEWGQALQQSRPSKGTKSNDVTLDLIGYQTDNGAYYCFCNDKNCSQTLIEEMKYLKDIGIPMGYLSFQGGGASSGRGTAAPWCVNTWGVDGGLSDRYPVSVKEMQKAIGIPLQLYAPYFCPDSPYFNETSKWNKVSSNTLFPSCSMFDFEDVRPEQSRAFYDDFFARGVAAGMISYESDFMNQNYNCVPEFVTTTTAAPMWQQGMADAAYAKNLTIQWCMATPSDVFASVDLPSVTNFRVSTDFCYGNSWNIGVSSLLVWALGAAPSKDTLWTSDNNRTAIPGCPWTPDHEAPGAELHVIFALMSTGPIGISDAIGMTNATLLKRTITVDGTLLKPAKPITAIDSSFLAASVTRLQGYVYGTAGFLGRSWHFVSFKMKQSFPVRLRDFWPSPVGTDEDTVLAYRFFHQNPSCKDGTDAVASGCMELVVLNNTADPSMPVFVAPASSFENVTGGSDFSPTFTTVWRGCHPTSGWILLGELNKYVPLSPARFIGIVCTDKGVAFQLRGTPGEVVTVTSVDWRKKVVVHESTIPYSGEAMVRIESEGTIAEKPTFRATNAQ